MANPETLGLLYAVALCVLALLSTVPLLLPRPTGAAVVTALANVLVLAVFSAPTVAGALGAVFAAGRLGADGELRSVAGLPVGPAGAQYLAVGLALPFLVLALVRHENLAVRATSVGGSHGGRGGDRAAGGAGGADVQRGRRGPGGHAGGAHGAR